MTELTQPLRPIAPVAPLQPAKYITKYITVDDSRFLDCDDFLPKLVEAMEMKVKKMEKSVLVDATKISIDVDCLRSHGPQITFYLPYVEETSDYEKLERLYSEDFQAYREKALKHDELMMQYDIKTKEYNEQLEASEKAERKKQYEVLKEEFG